MQPTSFAVENKMPCFEAFIASARFTEFDVLMAFTLKLSLFIKIGGLGERCMLPQRGLGWSPS